MQNVKDHLRFLQNVGFLYTERKNSESEPFQSHRITQDSFQSQGNDETAPGNFPSTVNGDKKRKNTE